MKGLMDIKARKPSGEDQGTTKPNRNMMFHVHVHVRWNQLSKRHRGQRVVVCLTISFSTKKIG